MQSDGVFKVNNIVSGTIGNSTNNNASFGYSAMPNTSGKWNTAFGVYALFKNTTGANNTANGNHALRENTTGSYNTANGYGANYYNTTGSLNTVVGSTALLFNTTGGSNTVVGAYAVYENRTGSGNTAVGSYANYEMLNLNNTTAIGYYAENTASNQVRIGNSSVTSIGGYANWTNISDGRVKKNIRTEVPGLAFINLLKPVTYNLDMNAIDEIQKSDDPEINKRSDSIRMARSPEEKEIFEKARANKEKQVYSGFVAQDVEKAAKSVGYEFSGVDAPENEKSAYGLKYAEFVVPLVKAVQELSEQNNRLQEQVKELNAKLDKLTNVSAQPAAMGVNGESGSANNFTFSLFPNPTNGFVTVDYTMSVDAQIRIELYNLYGQRMKLIVPQQNQKEGTYSVQISVADLGTGTYIVTATSGNQNESKQLVINN